MIALLIVIGVLIMAAGLFARLGDKISNIALAAFLIVGAIIAASSLLIL